MKSILVIEDDASYRNSIELILKMEGFDVRTADNGASGLTLIREKQPDLILCDINMPELNGYSVLESLQSDRSVANIPFIFVTAMGGHDDMRRGMAGGADDYLPKPFTSDELISAVSGRLKRIMMFNVHDEGDPSDIKLKCEILSKKISNREREVLLLVGDGCTSKKIAERLGIRINTVEVHRANLMRKLDATNAASLSNWALAAEQMTTSAKSCPS